MVLRQPRGHAQEVRPLEASREEEGRQGNAAHQRRPSLTLVLTKGGCARLVQPLVRGGDRVCGGGGLDQTAQ